MSTRRDVLALCLTRGGYRRGARVAEFIGEWEIAVRNRKADLGIEEFSEWWRESRRTAYRRLSEFRAMFPEVGEHGTPSDLMRPLIARVEAGQVDDLEAVGLALP